MGRGRADGGHRLRPHRPRHQPGVPGPGPGPQPLPADGTEAKGFLVEAEAVKGARDVSAHGGWRAYLAAR